MKKLFWGGIHPKGNKSLSRGTGLTPVPAPKEVVLPMFQHIGAACTPKVQVGDSVKLGQLVGDGEGLCAPVHASVSGKVIAIENRPHTSGREILSVVIANDGLDTPDGSLTPYADFRKLTPEEILHRIHAAGIVGMGGAAFPTDVKAFSALDKVDYVIINACECEPYITADDTLLCTWPQEVLTGAEILKFALSPTHAVIAIEDNKPQAIAAMEAVCKGTEVEVRVLPTRYPQGAEKQLVCAVTGRQVPPGKLPAAAGCAVFNAATAYAVYQAVMEGKPLTQRILTVTGDGAKAPKNMLVRLGTTFAQTIEAAGGMKDTTCKVLSGGPMMGVAQGNLQAPVLKATNTILCLTDANTPAENPVCIRCGKCLTTCPMHLQPLYLYRAVNSGNLAELNRLNLMDCMECGCCSFGCPGKLPLVATFRKGKQMVKEAKKV